MIYSNAVYTDGRYVINHLESAAINFANTLNANPNKFQWSDLSAGVRCVCSNQCTSLSMAIRPTIKSTIVVDKWLIVQSSQLHSLHIITSIKSPASHKGL